VAIVLIISSHPTIHLGVLNVLHCPPDWPQRSGIFSVVSALYGFLLLTVALLSYVFYRQEGEYLSLRFAKHCWKSMVVLKEDVHKSIVEFFSSPQDVTWLFLAITIGIVVRGYFLSQPMRYDESYTFLNFVNKGFLNLFYYSAPNNHILHTLMVKLSTLIWGSHPASIRFPSFLAGLGSIPLTLGLCRQLSLRRSGILASIAMSVAPYMILYSTMARGYSLLVFLTLALALAGLRLVSNPVLANSLLVSLVAALGMFTMPSMLFPMAGVYLWIACCSLFRGLPIGKVFRKIIIPVCLMTILLTTIFYTPTIVISGGIEPIVANKFVRPLSWDVFRARVYPHFSAVFSDFLRDVPPLAVLVGVFLLGTGLFAQNRERNWTFLLLLPAMLMGAMTIFIIQHAIPFVRTWIYILPFVFIATDFGFEYLIKYLPAKFDTLLRVMLVVLTSSFVLSLVSRNAIAAYPDTGSFPEASAVARFLKPTLTKGDAVIARVPADSPTYFYLWYYDAPMVVDQRDQAQREFFVVQKSEYSIDSLTQKAVRLIFDFNDAAIYQNLGSGGKGDNFK